MGVREQPRTRHLDVGIVRADIGEERAGHAETACLCTRSTPVRRRGGPCERDACMPRGGGTDLIDEREKVAQEPFFRPHGKPERASKGEVGVEVSQPAAGS